MGDFPSPRLENVLKHFPVELAFFMEKALVYFRLVTLFLLLARNKRVFFPWLFSLRIWWGSWRYKPQNYGVLTKSEVHRGFPLSHWSTLSLQQFTKITI